VVDRLFKGLTTATTCPTTSNTWVVRLSRGFTVAVARPALL